MITSLSGSERATLAKILDEIIEDGFTSKTITELDLQNITTIQFLLATGGFSTEQEPPLESSEVSRLWTLEWANNPGNGEYPKDWRLIETYEGKEVAAAKRLIHSAEEYADSLPNNARVDVAGFGPNSGLKVYIPGGGGAQRYFRMN